MMNCAKVGWPLLSLLTLLLHFIVALEIDFVTAAAIETTCDFDCQEERLKTCCSHFIKDQTCLSLCRYNTTQDELSEKGVICGKSLKHWMYCATDGHDNTDCCKNNKVQDDCLPMCKGDGLKVCPNNIANLATFSRCIMKIGSVLSCHRNGLMNQSAWSKEKTFADDTCI